MRKDIELKCYLSAPLDRLNTIKKILNQLGVETTDSFQFNFGDLIFSNVKSRIRNTDFSVIVFSTENKENAAYELGICEGLRKPIFLIVNDYNYEIPRFLDQYFYLKTDFDDISLLYPSLKNFIDQQSFKNKNSSSNRKKLPDKPSQKVQSYYYLNNIRDFRFSGNEAQIENLLSDLFKQEGILFEQQIKTKKGAGVDFVVWDDKLNNIIGNPIIIEVKYGNLSRDFIRVAEKRLQTQLYLSKAKFGILLYLDKNRNRYREDNFLSPLIIREDLEDFVAAISASSFSETVLKIRNNMVHGAF